MRTIIDREIKISEEVKTERELTVLKNRLDVLGLKFKFVNPKSVEMAAEIIKIFRDETSKAVNNGGDVDFRNFICSASKIVERNKRDCIISEIS